MGGYEEIGHETRGRQVVKLVLALVRWSWKDRTSPPHSDMYQEKLVRGAILLPWLGVLECFSCYDTL